MSHVDEPTSHPADNPHLLEDVTTFLDVAETIPMLVKLKDAEGNPWYAYAYIVPNVYAVDKRVLAPDDRSSLDGLPKPLVVLELTVVPDAHDRVDLRRIGRD